MDQIALLSQRESKLITHRSQNDQTDEQDLRQFAKNISTLPEVPDAIKTLAKHYVKSNNPRSNSKQTNQILFKGTGNLSHLGHNSQSRNPDQQSLVNRSMSMKYLKLDQSTNPQSDGLNSKVGERVSELTGGDFIENKVISKTLYNNPGSQNNSGFMNLQSIKGFKQIQISQGSLPLNNNRLSPLPSKYKQHLPNIIKKRMTDATSTSVNFNPQGTQQNQQQVQLQQQSVRASQQNGNGFQSKKEMIRNFEFQQNNQVRQDVSYLKEKAPLPSESVQPTVFTTGIRGQDELLEATLGIKNLGKTLINLPQTIEELESLLLEYDDGALIKKDLKREQQEKHLDNYLNENFQILDSIPPDIDGKNVELPGISLKQYHNGLFQSKFLSSQAHQLSARGPAQNQSTSPFNLMDKKLLIDVGKKPKFIETKPKKLIQVDSKLMKKFAREAFLHQPKKQEQQSPESNQKQNLLNQNDNNTNKNLGKLGKQNQLKTIEAILNNSKFQSLQNSWFAEEKNESKTRTNDKTTSLSPINLKAQRKVSNNQLITSIVTSKTDSNFGNPSSRQDAILLILWFEKTLQTIESDLPQEQKEEKVFPLLQLTMNILVKELSRQVSVHCQERGLLLQRLFKSYTKLIDLMNKENKEKRWRIKRETTDKLDKYIQIQEGQVRGYKDYIEQLKGDYDKLKAELDESLYRYNQGQVLVQKFKKKCYNAQKDLESALRRLKFIEHENSDLKSKVTELCERFGEQMSEMDDEEKKRLLLKIDEELLDTKSQDNKKQDSEDDYDIDQIPDRDVIKEDDKGTDMLDFDHYLMVINQDRIKNGETQTDRVFKRHMKVGVTANKLGIFKDKETFTDPRMFQGDGAQQYRVGGTVEPEIKIEDQDHQDPFDLQEDDSDSDGLSDFYEEENDETLRELGLLGPAMPTNDLDQLALDFQNLKKVKRSLTSLALHNQNIDLDDLNEEKLKLLPQYGTQQVEDIINGVKQDRRHSEQHSMQLLNDLSNILGFADKQHQTQNKQSANALIGTSLLNALQTQEQSQLKKKKKKGLKQTIMELFAKRIRSKIKDLLTSDQIDLIKQTYPQFTKLLVTDLKSISKDVKQMDEDIQKKDKQVRFQFKLNKKNEKQLRQSINKVDGLEMDNYNYREIITDLCRCMDDYEINMSDIMAILDRDSMGQLTINELRSKMSSLSEKITQAKTKAAGNQISDDILYKTSDIQADNMNELLSQNNSQNDINPNGESAKMDLLNTNPKIMSNQGPRTYSNSKHKSNFQVNQSPSTQDILKKKAITRFQLFNIGNNRKSPIKKQRMHPGNMIAQKILQKDPKQLKDFMPRKMLLRVVYQVYQERSYYDMAQLNQNMNTTGGQNNIQQNPGDKSLGNTQQTFNAQGVSQAPLLEWIYDSFMQKYGLKNVAEKKFVQLISSCIVQKNQLHRIRLFGRFLELYQELSALDYNRYLEINDLFTGQILNFKIDDDVDSILLPVNRAIDYFKMKFEPKFLQQHFNQKIQKIERMKVPVGLEDAKNQKHLKGVREAVDFDQFAEFVLDTFIHLQEEREQSIKDIYLAVDLNNDGFIHLQEFQMLMKIFYYKSSREVIKIFDEYGQYAVDAQNSNNVEKDFQNLTDQLPIVLSLFKSRLVAVSLQDDFDCLDLLENFQNSIKYPFSAKVGWLCYRIVDEIFKRIYLKKMSEMYMPYDFKKDTGIKLKPSQSIINMVPFTLYDTL